MAHHRLVSSTAELDDVVAVLVDQPRYAVDTEFHRERTYYPRVALVQIAWEGGLALIDPLAVSLEPLAKVLDGPGLAVLHALVTTARVRRHDLAVLRTLGFQRRQLGRTLAWQATAIGAAGLVVGVPLGVVVGRLVWQAVAGGIGVVETPVVPLVAIAVVVAAVLLVLNLAAVLPGRSARRVSPAVVLRSG